MGADRCANSRVPGGIAGATGALDYESEAIIQRNMGHICKGRTVLIIAHRLSAVRNANRIIVMDKGRIVEAGSHEALLQQSKGLYAHLWAMQDGTKVDDSKDEGVRASTPPPPPPALP